MKKVRIVIVAKAPIAGFAKTRLIPALGAQGAAQLARKMLVNTIEAALAARLGAVELCCAPDPQDAHWQSMSLPPDLVLTGQGEGDLGQRLARAARRVIANGEAVLLIGTDCPDLTAARLIGCAAALDTAQGVMAPTLDGGYALLGLNRFDPSLFSGIAWSTASVARDTLHRFHLLGWRVECGEYLRDIDEPDDVPFLPMGWR